MRRIGFSLAFKQMTGHKVEAMIAILFISIIVLLFIAGSALCDIEIIKRDIKSIKKRVVLYLFFVTLTPCFRSFF